jgi:hypothetical protein
MIFRPRKRSGVFRIALAIPFSLGLIAAASAPDPEVFLSVLADRDTEPTADALSDFWKDAPGIFIERSILGGPVLPHLRAEVRSRWTPRHIYFLFIGPFQALNLKPSPDTGTETYRLWEWDCFEVYARADFEPPHRYREFQMSPQGEFLDLDIDSTAERPGHSNERLWESGMKVKARIDTAARIWYGEMRIPLAAIDVREPKAGNELRINLFRQDGRAPHRDFLAWRITGVWNPHHPEKFGKLRLVAAPSR